MLCSNREENFGPSSYLSSPLPTTCFTDIVIIPLPVWLYFVLLVALIVLTRKRRRRYVNPTAAPLGPPPRRSILRNIIVAVYYFFIFANILMVTVEIVRLELIYFGIGLLPFSYVALILGFIVHITNGLRGKILGRFWRGANTFLWIGLMIVNLVKTAGLVKMENHGIYRTGSKYPMSDQVIDAAVMAGLYLGLAALEVSLGLWRRKGVIIE